VSPGVEECRRLSRLRVVVVKSEKLVADAAGEFGNAEKGGSPPVEAATKQRLVEFQKTLCVL
jgi:hypothetical protein